MAPLPFGPERGNGLSVPLGSVCTASSCPFSGFRLSEVGLVISRNPGALVFPCSCNTQSHMRFPLIAHWLPSFGPQSPLAIFIRTLHPNEAYFLYKGVLMWRSHFQKRRTGSAQCHCAN